MSTPLQGTPPVGIDGAQPIYQPAQPFRIFALDQVWMGPGNPGLNKWVPNVDDRVIDRTTNEWFDVVSLDPTTWAADLAPITNATPDTQFTPAEQLISPDPRNPQSTVLLYLDKSVSPNEATPDERNFTYGTQSKYAQFFIGSFTDGTAKIFSAMYDQSGNLLGNNVPLINVNDSGTMKTCPSFKTTIDIPDSEIITMVKYSDSGQVTAREQMRVVESTFISKVDPAIVYITGISLESPWISDLDANVIRYPLNTPLASLNLVGVVTYSDGSTRRYPVNGGKFRIVGIEPQFVSTIIDQKFPAVLYYFMDPTEQAYGVTVNQNNFIPRDYSVQTVEPDGQYTVKLYGYPQWIDSVNGYRLDWFLGTLDRSVMMRVTSLINYVTPFNPLLFGVTQNVQVNIDLSQVNGTFKEFLFTQIEGITLLSRGDQPQTNWTLAFSPGQNPPYGINLKATSLFQEAALSTLNLSSGFTTQTDWLNAFYGNTQPLLNSVSEATLPVPTHFQILYGNTDLIQEFTIDQWNQNLQVPFVFPTNSTAYVRFISRQPSTDLLLSVAGFQVVQTN